MQNENSCFFNGMHLPPRKGMVRAGLVYLKAGVRRITGIGKGVGPQGQEWRFRVNMTGVSVT